MVSRVVYRPFPTSNHNLLFAVRRCRALYIVRFLHQTTTTERLKKLTPKLYIVRFLHQTTTDALHLLLNTCCISSVSYIKPQLRCQQGQIHARCISSVSYIKPQPGDVQHISIPSCISSVSYIKPQPSSSMKSYWMVVYRPFPTSNHNRGAIKRCDDEVVYRPFPTSNHNCLDRQSDRFLLYIVRFLHQTTTCSSDFPIWWTLYIVRFLHQTTTA